jgi:redox-sensitive bicupin YhaK (pirin superfamily)
MYEIARRVQRKRDHTESFLSFKHPFLGTTRSRFGSLLQFQETLLQPSSDWSSGPIGNVEIVTLVLKGSLTIQSESQNRSTLELGGIHCLSRSSGMLQVENLSAVHTASYCQIWLDAEDQRIIPTEAFTDSSGLVLLASGQGEAAGVSLQQDVAVYLSTLKPSETLIFETLSSRKVFLAVLDGLVRLEEYRLQDSDSALIWKENLIEIAAQRRSRLLLVDLS